MLRVEHGRAEGELGLVSTAQRDLRLELVHWTLTLAPESHSSGSAQAQSLVTTNWAACAAVKSAPAT